MVKYVYYHSADLDGHCSGEIARRALTASDPKGSDVVMIGINYGDPYYLTHKDTDDLWFVDICPDVLPEADNITIIDHHKTKDHIQTDINAGKYKGIIDTSGDTPATRMSACELCWKYFYSSDMPLFIKLLGRYDVWDHFNPHVLPFQYGMRTYETLPGSQIWDELFSGITIQHIINIGDRLIFKEEKDNTIRMKHAISYRLSTTAGSIDVIASIGAPCNSLAFKSVFDPLVHHAMMNIVYNKSGWRISLYNNNAQIDLSPIAKASGGGGHAHACGFQVKSLKELGLNL